MNLGHTKNKRRREENPPKPDVWITETWNEGHRQLLRIRLNTGQILDLPARAAMGRVIDYSPGPHRKIRDHGASLSGCDERERERIT